MSLRQTKYAFKELKGFTSHHPILSLAQKHFFKLLADKELVKFLKKEKTKLLFHNHR